MKTVLVGCGILVLSLGVTRGAELVVLFEDGFEEMRTGAIGNEVGAHLEYHYLPKINTEGQWAISTFSSGAPSQRAWRIVRHDGQAVLLQVHENKLAHTRPTIVAGDELWADYSVNARFTPETNKGRSGVIVRYHNDRCYYFVGVQESKAVLKVVQHEKEYRVPDEKLLAGQEFGWKPGQEVKVEIVLQGSRITATLNGKTLTADDRTYKEGRIALTADSQTRFSEV